MKMYFMALLVLEICYNVVLFFNYQLPVTFFSNFSSEIIQQTRTSPITKKHRLKSFFIIHNFKRAQISKPSIFFPIFTKLEKSR